MPAASWLWVTIPIGLAMYVPALLVWFRGRRADGKAPQESRVQEKLTVTVRDVPALDEDQWVTTTVLQQESEWVRVGLVQIQAHIGNKSHDPETGNVRYDLLHLRFKPDRVLHCKTDLLALTVYRSDLDEFVPDALPFEPVKILGFSCQMFPGRETTAMLVNCTEQIRFTGADQVKRREKGTWRATLRISSEGNEIGVLGVTFGWSPKNGLSSPLVTLDAQTDLEGPASSPNIQQDAILDREKKQLRWKGPLREIQGCIDAIRNLWETSTYGEAFNSETGNGDYECDETDKILRDLEMRIALITEAFSEFTRASNLTFIGNSVRNIGPGDLMKELLIVEDIVTAVRAELGLE